MKNLSQKTETFIQSLLNTKPATKSTITIKLTPKNGADLINDM